METLLRNYSLQDMLLFIVVLSLAVKGFITFYDWAKDRLKKVFDKEYQNKETQEDIKSELNKNNKEIENIKSDMDNLEEQLNVLSQKIDMLINSDKDDIKSFLTKEHHFFCNEKGWIDNYSLECCERRYEHYREEGGNSFIEGFMEDLRSLPNVPPTSI